MDFRNMGLWTLPRGRRDSWRSEQSKAEVDDVMLGSLELLFDDSQRDEASSFEQAIAESAAANRDRHRRGVADDPFADDSAMVEGLGKVAIALTNPPFSSLKNMAKDVDSEVRVAMVQRMAKVRDCVAARWPEHDDAVSADSLQPSFSYILAECINRSSGVVGMIVPTTVWNATAARRADDTFCVLGRILLRKYASRSTHWPMYQPAAIKRLVIPNTASKLWPRMREPLLDAYRATKDAIVPQYRERDAEVRRIWDQAVAKAAEIPHRTVHGWRELLDIEPFVSGVRERQRETSS